MRRFTFLMVAITFATLAAGASTPLFAAQWSNYHWPSSNFQLDVANKASGEYDVSGVVSRWNAALPAGGPQMTINGGVDIEIRSKNFNANYLGVAEILVDTTTGHILEGRVTLNHRYLKDGNLYGFDDNVRTHVACQEVGHILGLDHQSGNSCMNDEFSTLGDYTTHNSEDTTTLNDMYGSSHVDEDSGTPPPDDGGSGGPPCSKNPNHANCRPQGAVWITVHKIPVPQR